MNKLKCRSESFAWSHYTCMQPTTWPKKISNLLFFIEFGEIFQNIFSLEHQLLPASL